jgi:hypothetical protein
MTDCGFLAHPLKLSVLNLSSAELTKTAIGKAVQTVVITTFLEV